MVQKMIIDTLHKESKSQGVITERGGLFTEVGKCAQATEMSASLRILSSKADSNTWESFRTNRDRLLT